MKAAGALGAAAPILGSILNPPGWSGLVLGWVWLSEGPHLQTKFQFCRVPRMGGIKLQLLCGVRIELAVGSLPNLARIPSRSLPLPLGGT